MMRLLLTTGSAHYADRALVSAHPRMANKLKDTSEGNQEIARRLTLVRRTSPDPLGQIDAEIAEKGHLWMGTS